MKNIALFLILGFSFSLNALCSDMFLVKATNDEDDLVTNLYLVLNERNDIRQFKIKTFEDEKVVLEKVFETDEGNEGIVIERQKGRDIVTLYSSNFSEHQGGNVTLSYLYNGLTGTTRQLELDLDRTGDQWDLRINGRKTSHLHFVSNKKFMVGAIGVKKVRIVK